MLDLSERSGLFTRCLEIGGEDLRKVGYGGFADIWTGRIDNLKVAVKLVRDRIDSQKHEVMKVSFKTLCITHHA